MAVGERLIVLEAGSNRVSDLKRALSKKCGVVSDHLEVFRIPEEGEGKGKATKEEALTLRYNEIFDEDCSVSVLIDDSPPAWDTSSPLISVNNNIC
jgi:hypothetical protein